MQAIGRLTGAEIAEAHQSANTFYGIEQQVAALAGFMRLLHARDWLDLKPREDKAAVRGWLDRVFGDPVAITRGGAEPVLERDPDLDARFAAIRPKHARWRVRSASSADRSHSPACGADGRAVSATVASTR